MNINTSNKQTNTPRNPSLLHLVIDTGESSVKRQHILDDIEYAELKPLIHSGFGILPGTQNFTVSCVTHTEAK